MKTSDLWRSSLRAALNSPSCDAVEISACFEAISKRSPIVQNRIARALEHAADNHGLDALSENDREIVRDVLASLDRQPGRPPDDDEPATGHIHLRVTMERKNRYVRAARKRNLKLSKWMTDALDRESGK